MKKEMFTGSLNWLYFWIFIFWPVAVIYILMNKDYLDYNPKNKK